MNALSNVYSGAPQMSENVEVRGHHIIVGLMLPGNTTLPVELIYWSSLSRRLRSARVFKAGHKGEIKSIMDRSKVKFGGMQKI